MRGRFAPSPTGYMHLGNVWTALLCWLQVRQAGGTLILRLEDIDEQRSRPAFAKALLEDMQWLGLYWDEGPGAGGCLGPYIQQKRYALYGQVMAYLQEKGLLYPCYCTRTRLQAVAGAPHIGEQVMYDGHCYGLTAKERMAMTRKPSWRVHVPHRTVVFMDSVYGRQEEELTCSCGDFVVRRADGMYAYQLAVSADDAAMGITHVLRGCDLLSSTARQIWLMELLGAEAPQYTHVPLLLDREGRRLSKRQQGITVRSLREEGIRPQQILSYLAWKGGLIGEYGPWTLDELVMHGQLGGLSRNNIVIDGDIGAAIRQITN